jgi:hypothetical protein
MHDATSWAEMKKPATARRAGFVIDVFALAERHLTRTVERTTTHAGGALAHFHRRYSAIRRVHKLRSWNKAFTTEITEITGNSADW